jgi:hypothetical protein
MFSFIKLRGALIDGTREAIKKMDVPAGDEPPPRAGPGSGARVQVLADDGASDSDSGIRVV